MSLINGKCKKRLTMALLFLLLCFAGILQVSAAGNVVASAPEAAAGAWRTTEDGIRYQYTENGGYATNVWRRIDGSIYRFDKQGYVVTGWFNSNGSRYYADSDGKLYVGKWAKRGGKYYYLLDDGTLAKKRMIKYGNNYYYVDKSGERVTNSWVTRSGKKYYFDKQGVRLQNMWIRDNGKFYYLGPTGEMAKKQWVDDGRYYVGANGARKTNCTVDGYYLDENGKKTVKAFYGDYIIVGDSRTVGMKLAVAPENTKYIAKESMGYSWLESTAGPELKEYLDINPDISVVLAFGVNDLGNVQKYIAYYKKLIKKYPKTRFYVEAVNPVNEKIEAAHGYTVRNKQIQSFNQAMRTAIGKNRFLNTYTYLKKKGFQTSDGVHYTLEEYRGLYDFITEKIGA